MVNKVLERKTKAIWSCEYGMILKTEIVEIGKACFVSKSSRRWCGSLVFFSFLAFSLQRVHTDFLVVLLKGSQIFTSFGKLSFFHTFSHVPVDKGTFGVHQIKFMIQTSPCFSNGSCVGQHADSTGNLSQVASRNNSGGLVVDTNLEACRAPIHKLDRPLSLDGSNGSIDIFGEHLHGRACSRPCTCHDGDRI